MGAIGGLDDLANRLSGGGSSVPRTMPFFKDATVDGSAAAAPVAGRWTSLWQYAGFPGGGAAVSTGALPSNTTNGALKQASPGGGRTDWLLGASWSGSLAGTLLIYDRLFHVGGLSGTTTTAQSVSGTGPVSRYANSSETSADTCFGNQILIEIQTEIGTTATTATVDYKDQAGSTVTSPAFAIGGTNLREAQRLIWVPIQPGDGVTDLVNFDLVATTGTAGDIALVIARPLLMIPCGISNVSTLLDLIISDPGVVSLKSGACVAFAWMANNTTVPQVFGHIQILDA